MYNTTFASLIGTLSDYFFTLTFLMSYLIIKPVLQFLLIIMLQVLQDLDNLNFLTFFSHSNGNLFMIIIFNFWCLMFENDLFQLTGCVIFFSCTCEWPSGLRLLHSIRWYNITILMALSFQSNFWELYF